MYESVWGLQEDLELKIIITCRCGNPKGNVNERCQNCTFFIYKELQCDICGYTHKIRPRSFCEALQNHTINKPETKDRIVADILARRI